MITTYSLPPTLDFLQPSLDDDLGTLPTVEQARLGQRMQHHPSLALALAKAILETSSATLALMVVPEDKLDQVMARLQDQARTDEPDVRALRRRQVLKASQRLITAPAINVSREEPARFAHRLQRLHTLLQD